jgi:putative GTP pyrophosphokinase
MKNSVIDRLGERLRHEVSSQDLTLLDTYRRGFRPAYDVVVDRIRDELGLEVSGRPAKSTAAIVDKLRRGTMRLTQMQDISGCRILVPDIATQSQLISTLESMFEVVIVDRRIKPSHGYRAVHVIVQNTDFPVEIQLRTELQHAWAELSEKLADAFGIDTKYGGGPPEIRSHLDALSRLVAALEELLDEAVGGQEDFMSRIRHQIRRTMNVVKIAMRDRP